jgi:pyrimidine-nucleoside phosphorylase
MRAVDIIQAKRDGRALTTAEIRFFVDGVTAGTLPDYQASSLLMAIFLRGMTTEETASLTDAMVHSGVRVDLSDISGVKVDKHSTGGVGDKTSLILAPLAAACGVPVPMMSGRGLGHTGGTLDKLESIPGFRVNLSLDEMKAALSKTGCAMIGQTAQIAPADKKLYALRDVTGTVESIPLISASIMSKKIAEGIDALVLDVKTGSGAFMRKYQDSKALAQSLIAAAHGSGTRVEALITDMDRPLGVAAGNANEIIETIDCLKGRGPEDVMEVTRAQAVRLLVMSGRYDETSAGAALDDALSSGRALEQARKWIAAQGGDASIVDDYSLLPQPKTTIEVKAPRSGFITHIDTYQAGMFTVDLGAGRKKADDQIDYAAGVMFDRRSGEAVKSGDVIARIQLGAAPQRDAEELRARFLAFVEFGDAPPEARPLVHEHLS